MIAAGLLASLVGALFARFWRMGTTAVMLKAAWLRNWLYHGQHLWYGVQNLSADLRTLPAIAYSHELTGSVDADVLNAIVVFFPVDRACTDRMRSDKPDGRRRGGPGRPAARWRRPSQGPGRRRIRWRSAASWP